MEKENGFQKLKTEEKEMLLKYYKESKKIYLKILFYLFATGLFFILAFGFGMYCIVNILSKDLNFINLNSPKYILLGVLIPLIPASIAGFLLLTSTHTKENICMYSKMIKGLNKDDFVVKHVVGDISKYEKLHTISHIKQNLIDVKDDDGVAYNNMPVCASELDTLIVLKNPDFLLFSNGQKQYLASMTNFEDIEQSVRMSHFFDLHISPNSKPFF